MANKMLIDAAHPEETRVAVLRGNRIEEFDFESSTRKQLRGNIYLAKVTRVEPSLQAAFVDYGGNRHGFLAFSEIHPDYYQIPVADRQALLDQDAAEDTADLAKEDAEDGGDKKNAALSAGEGETATDSRDEKESPVDDENGDESAGEGDKDESVELVGAEDAMAEVPQRRRARERKYKIQEVIKRRQIILVQVVKEERGTKGAALTTYLSLAGRYCVLMPNTARGGGISRKIINPGDRKRLKEIATGLSVPDGTGLIIRTAGAKRTKAEIKRDFEYLLRLWETVRDLTLESSAPSLVYEEGSLIKRSLRDLYNKDIDEVLIEGDEGYKEAKAFMRMLMPSHAKNIKSYKESHPLFMLNQIESQLDALFQPRVTLRSGGYLVINQTEALVSIDINSGRSTREHNIENTALKTNLEAADEIARQLRLRDLAGLIVIDFIDMEERRNNRSVERKIKECLKSDRARIQVGRISHFGLLEMSRQRMRSGLVEGSTLPCKLCQGHGYVRSVASAALFILREIEENILKNKPADIAISTSTDTAMYILNQKRDHLLSIQERYNVTVLIEANSALNGIELEFGRAHERPAGPVRDQKTVQPDSGFMPQEDQEDDTKSRRRRKRRRRGRRRDVEIAAADDTGADKDADKSGEDAAVAETTGPEEDVKPKRSRRARRPRSKQPQVVDTDGARGEDKAATQAVAQTATQAVEQAKPEIDGTDDTDKTAKSKGSSRRGRGGRQTGSRRRNSKSAADAGEPIAANAEPSADAGAQGDDVSTSPRHKPAGAKRKNDAAVKDAAGKAAADNKKASKTTGDGGNGADKRAPAHDAGTSDQIIPQRPSGPRRTGWWQKRD